MSNYEHILVAIHGIGEQSRNMTVRAVATRLALSAGTIGKEGEPPPLAPQPLGWFYSDVQGVVKVAPLDAFDPATKHSMAAIGFTEAF